MKHQTKNFFINIIFFFQKILFFISLFLTSWIPRNETNNRLIIGRETAGLLTLYSNLFDCYSINIDANKFLYNSNYSLDLSKLPKLLRLIILPIIFPIVLKKYSNVWYFSSASFFLSNDGRDWEFHIIKNNSRKITCFFLGSDIRSLKLAQELSSNINIDHWSNHIDTSPRKTITKHSDKRSWLYSQAADKYSDYIFSAENDNISYIKSKIFLIPMPVGRNNYLVNDNKWNNHRKIKIFHCPSSPLIKGTRFVESAIKKLKSERYQFDFKLLENASNDEVLRELDQSHIVLNEFYGYCPGLLGLEALESNCLLLTSASKKLEPSLFGDPKDAWVPTMYDEVYDNLKYYLDNIDEAKIIADRGTEWAKEHCSHEASINYVNKILS